MHANLIGIKPSSLYSQFRSRTTDTRTQSRRATRPQTGPQCDFGVNPQSSFDQAVVQLFVHLRVRKAMMSGVPVTNSERFLHRESSA